MFNIIEYLRSKLAFSENILLNSNWFLGWFGSQLTFVIILKYFKSKINISYPMITIILWVSWIVYIVTLLMIPIEIAFANYFFLLIIIKFCIVKILRGKQKHCARLYANINNNRIIDCPENNRNIFFFIKIIFCHYLIIITNNWVVRILRWHKKIDILPTCF